MTTETTRAEDIGTAAGTMAGAFLRFIADFDALTKRVADLEQRLAKPTPCPANRDTKGDLYMCEAGAEGHLGPHIFGDGRAP